MSRVLLGLSPKRVFQIFEDICSIPHGSGNTKQISDYCVNFAKKLGLHVLSDELNNVIIKKPASIGYESHEPVVLQGHLDMVCEKEADCDFDFTKDAIKIKVSGDYVSASGTTLGGDDGIAVAIILAILEDDTIKSPPIEAIFTTDEETGMYGAAGLDTSSVTAKRFINIDSEDEGVFTVGCAGGARVDISLPLESETYSGKAYKVEISGLIGGHSGTEINKGRLNANKVLAGFLKKLGKGTLISEISGGSKDNAIPVNASCVVCSNADIFKLASEYENENCSYEDNNLKITVNSVKSETAFSRKASKQIIEILSELPSGVISMSRDIEGLVETSLNLGIMRITDKAFHISLSVRSSKSAEKRKLIKRLEEISKKYNANFSPYGDYPAWGYRKNSPLRDKMIEVFKYMYGSQPKIEVIHAGLECGLFAEKIKDIDAVSIGPDLFDIHTPRERLSISSVERTYNYICNVLEAL
ncbi:MAG: aminoacyl-histidine dipeptidase [Clostridia bacterium]|nr:aminoacyl-histidine dipeptidase [Clostridia bacterium]